MQRLYLHATSVRAGRDVACNVCTVRAGQILFVIEYKPGDEVEVIELEFLGGIAFLC